MTKNKGTEHTLSVTVAPAPDGDGYDVDASCRCVDRDGRVTQYGWVHSGWSETPGRSLAGIEAEWSAHIHNAV